MWPTNERDHAIGERSASDEKRQHGSSFRAHNHQCFARVLQVSQSTLFKAKNTYGQVVLRLVDASTDDILAHKNAIVLYESAASRATGKNRPASGANAIIKAAAAGDKAGANAGLKKLVADTKLSAFKSCDVVSGAKFVDAGGVACMGVNSGL